MSVELLKQEFVPKYLEAGEPNKFYRFLLFYAINKMVLIEQGFVRGITPDVAFLDCHDQFIILHRREGENHYLDMARAFRRAAHKVYRVMLKKQLTAYNPRFLNLV
jgi:hypothetical protein